MGKLAGLVALVPAVLLDVEGLVLALVDDGLAAAAAGLAAAGAGAVVADDEPPPVP